MTHPPVPALRRCLLLAIAVLPTLAVLGDDSATVRNQFAQPGRDFSSGPLWVWNDLLTEEQIVSTLEDLAGQQVKQVFVHPRPGLMTPYLSPDWFRLWKRSLREAERLDMNVWIYDENSYPSGFAGGLVPEAMPESRGKGVAIELLDAPPAVRDDVLAVYRREGERYVNVTGAYRSDVSLPEGRYLVAAIRLAPTGGWFGGKFYVDLLMPGVTEKFLEITMDAYRREIGEHFGGRVPGMFTDEPHLAPAGGLHWSDHLPQLFEQRWGYDLLEHLPSLVQPVGDWKRVRHNYYQLLLEQFIERWARPVYEYCQQHQLEFTGHYWEHGWPGAGHGGDNMAMYAWHQRPAIDILMNQYSEDVNAQFGNVRAVLELASVANQLGWNRTLCEAYGAGGWDLRLEDMKRIGDWLYVLGVNTLNEHLSYITIRGARKRDHPQSFSYHAPWWDAYHIMARHFTRLSLVMSSGQQVNRILVLEPTTTTWMYQSTGELRELGVEFQKLVTDLAKSQVEFDIGCEDIIERHGSVSDGRFVVGRRAYDVVVLPAGVENLNSRTWDLLDAYLSQGGSLWAQSDPPTRADGQPTERGKTWTAHAHFAQVPADALAPRLLAAVADGFAIEQDPQHRGLLFHHRRQVDDGQFVLLVNTSIDSPSRGVVRTTAGHIEQWDTDTGAIRPAAWSRAGEGIEAEFMLPPSGHLLWFMADEPGEAAAPARVTGRAPVPPTSDCQIQRLEPNVLTLDYLDVTVGDETRRNQYFYQAADFVFRRHGLEGNPWDRAVQLRDELIRTSFPADSGLSATYRFVIRDQVPADLRIVIERADLYTITCNGQSVTASEGEWWLDRAFGVVDLSRTARVGDNAVTVTASPMTMYHELEPAYVLGSFGLEAAPAGFEIVPDRPLSFRKGLVHDNQLEGQHWLSAGIGFHRDPAGEGNDGRPQLVFDLGASRQLAGIEIWNYNEANLSVRGVKDLSLHGATTDSTTFPISWGDVQLAAARGDAYGESQRIPLSPQAVRFVRFTIGSNHRGVQYPTRDGNIDNAFVGLSEVRFLERVGDELRPIDGVTVHSVSSELTVNHDRRASYLLDGSGLREAGLGWNGQGHPFYGAGVAYRQTFDVPDTSGEYAVVLGDWYGSVAKVAVNGQLVGHIASPPWQYDVTPWLRPGRNEIEITVIGTPKNTLGPHHAGPLRGAAWPHMFQQGPATGPPPGNRYDTIGYGMYEPFELVRITREP